MTIRFRASLLLLSAWALLLPACTQVVETVPLGMVDLRSPTTCHSEFGYYFLPRALLTFAVKADETKPSKSMDFTKVTVVADRGQTFCLDYLSSPTSIDQVTVARDPNGLLLNIGSNVEDRTPVIINKLIQTGENLSLAAARDNTVAENPTDTLTLTIDPFLWSDLMLAKSGLRRFGYCLYVEGYSFPIEGLSAAQIQAAASKWCSQDANSTAPYEHPLQKFSSLPVSPEVMSGGVLYRPRTAHKIVILEKSDPYGRGPWELYQTKRFDLPNVSPVLAIGIERAAFTKRITTLNFNQGTLADVQVDKDSELAGFVSIPLTLAKAIADVPAQLIKIRLADVQGQAALVQAQGQLVNALSAYDKLVHPVPVAAVAPAGLPKSTDVRQGEFTGGCVDAGGPQQVCKDLAEAR